MENKELVETTADRLKILVRTWKFWKPIVAASVGAVLGYLYFLFVGCESGNCLFSGDPVSSTIVGAFFGLFMVYNPCIRGRC